jgi:hypothetical protein
VVLSPFASIGNGSDTIGYWVGDISSNKLVVAPKSTEVQLAWGSYGTVRGTTSTTNGLANTNTLYAFGNSITTGHPAAYYCKTLTMGGYDTWYLPAIDELTTLYSNKSATPFATTNSSVGGYWYLSSSERNTVQGAYHAMQMRLSVVTIGITAKKYPVRIRAVRRTTV